MTCFILRLFEHLDSHDEDLSLLPEMESIADIAIYHQYAITLVEVTTNLTWKKMQTILHEYYNIIYLCKEKIPILLDHLKFEIMCRKRSTKKSISDISMNETLLRSMRHDFDNDAFSIMSGILGYHRPIDALDYRVMLLDRLWRQGIKRPNYFLRSCMGYILEHYNSKGKPEDPQELSAGLSRLYFQEREITKARLLLQREGPADVESLDVLVITEGKTDWKHLKAALSALRNKSKYENCEIEFHEYSDELRIGDTELLKMCESLSKVPRPYPTICIFDRDVKSIIRKVSGDDRAYKSWGNNVFSFPLPVPQHRNTTPEISIEFYYDDDEITRADKYGRRLFLSTEFHDGSGRHKILDLNCTQLNKIRRSTVTIIDNGVYDSENNNMSLPKSKFASYILDREVRFNDVDFSSFEDIFDIVVEIFEESRTIGK